MPASTGLAGDRSATQLMSADLHNFVHSDLPAPHVFYNDRTHTVHPSSPPGAPRIPATIATFHSPCLFPAVLDQAQLHPFGAIPNLSETHTSPVQRTQVISSAPEVSYSSTPAQDSDAWVAYVKSWSLDAASPNGILHSSRVAPNTLIRPFTDGMPVPEQTGDMVVQQPICETLHPGRFDGVKSLDSSPLSNLVSYQPVCVGNSCCLHKPRKLMDSAVLHHRDSQLATDNMVTCRPGHTEICKHATTLPPPTTTDLDERGATLQATTNTMTSQRHTLNPIEAHFRSLTEIGVSLQDTAETLADSGANTLTGNSSAFRKISRFQRYFREAVSAVKSATRTKIFSQDEETSDEDEEVIGNQGIRLRSSRQARGRREFVQIKLIQEMKNEHTGAIWAMRFSPCGRLLATAGYDRSIRIWVLRQWYSYFRRMQQYASGPVESPEFGSSATFMNEADASLVDEENLFDSVSLASTSVSTTGKTDDGASTSSSTQACMDRLDQKSLPGVTSSVLSARVTSSSLKLPPDLERGRRTVFRSQPLLVYRGHEGVITEVAWSKNLFLLATSMDHQVRLWHISRRECLCLFSHNDTVPTIVFHPKDDRYFLSGSLDGKLRLWNIPDKKVRFWVEVPMPSALPVSNSGSASTGGFAASSFIKSSPLTPHISSGTVRNFNPRTIITCATFACEGTKVVVGTYDGRVMFFNSE
ncbi:WD repeat-containing protein 44, partial [Paragonimus westermani]